MTDKDQQENLPIEENQVKGGEERNQQNKRQDILGIVWDCYKKNDINYIICNFYKKNFSCLCGLVLCVLCMILIFSLFCFNLCIKCFILLFIFLVSLSICIFLPLYADKKNNQSIDLNFKPIDKNQAEKFFSFYKQLKAKNITCRELEKAKPLLEAWQKGKASRENKWLLIAGFLGAFFTAGLFSQFVKDIIAFITIGFLVIFFIFFFYDKAQKIQECIYFLTLYMANEDMNQTQTPHES